MKWTDEIPNDVGSIVELLKKHDCFWSVVIELLFCIYCFVMFVVNDWDVDLLVIALGSFVISAKTIELAFAKDRAGRFEAKTMDLADGLVVKEHEVERLTLELETAQAALVEAKKPNTHYSGCIQTGLAQVESSAIASTIDVATSEAPLPKPKRKPAPRGTRKPKTKNENKN